MPPTPDDDFERWPAARLRVGLFVRLETSWLNHPFSTSAFRIRNAEQLAKVQALGQPTVLVSPSRSDPESPGEAPISPAPPAVQAVAVNRPEPEKQQRLVAIARQREAFQRCERQFSEAADAVRELNRSLAAHPEACRDRLAAFAQQLTSPLLTDRDVALTVVGDARTHADEHLHGVNVSVMALVLGRELGLDEASLSELGQAAVLHDVGKVRVPTRLLAHPEALKGEDLKTWQRHAEYGARIAADVGCSPNVVEAIRQHHEHVDGTGYPQGLSGGQLSPLARIIAIANTFDDLCNHPNPQRSLTPYEALAHMFAKDRAHFDIAMLSTFIRTLGVYPPGSLVRLSNDMTAMVFSVNAEKPLKPTVLLHDPSIPRADALLINLEDDPDLNIVRNLRPSQLTPQELAYLTPRKRLTYYFDEIAEAGP